MLIDDITIKVRAGNGGRGAVAFDKNKLALGPTGGNGGRGGSVYVTAVSDIGALDQFRHNNEVSAGDGERGRAQFVDGADGANVVLRLPIGTVIHNLGTGEDTELMRLGEEVRIASGGRGGKGNYKFRSPTNTTPQEFQPGGAGETFELHLELKLIADVGFVGFPNVGKSSLLNELTRAKAKVANYKFTTLEPNLGAYYDLILADIPGLIEGAAEGKGLGMKFLRHIERTRTLFHFVAADSEDPAADYHAIRRELGEYNKALLEKIEYVFLSRSDTVDASLSKKKIAALKKRNPHVTAISIYDDVNLEAVKKILNKLNKEKGSTM